MINEQEMVAAVKKHAEAHYNDGGWDVIVECWSDDDIAAAIHRCTTANGAIALVSRIVGVYAERQADAEYHRRQAVGEDY